MKKLTKFLYWTICTSSILIGGLILGVGISLGGTTSFSINSNGFNFNNDISLSEEKTDSELFENIENNINTTDK